MSKLLTKLKYKFSPTVVRFSHEWTIEKFSSYLTANHPWKWPLHSESISPLDNDQLVQLYFRLQPNKPNHQDYLSIGIVFSSCRLQSLHDNVKLHCEIEIGILDQYHKVCYSKKGRFKLVQNDCSLTADNYIRHSDLLNSRSAYLKNDKLKLRFQVKLLARNDLFTNVQSTLAYVPVGESRNCEAAKVTHLEYKWTIQNCDCLFKEDVSIDNKKDKSIAPLFIQSNYLSGSGQSDHHKLKFKLYPRGLNYDSSSEFVDIELCTDSLKMNFLVYAKIEIVGTGKLPLESIGLIYHGKPVRYRNCITQKELMNLIKSQSEKHFTINCELTYMTCDEMPYESGFKEENVKNDLEYQLDATKTLACYTQKSYDNIKFADEHFQQKSLEPFALEMENQTFSLDAQWIENVNWFAVRLAIKTPGDVMVQGTIQFCVSLLDQFEQKCYTKEMQVNSLSSKESLGCGKYIRKAHLAHLLSIDKQVTKLLIEFWVNTKMQNSSSENVEFFKIPLNGSVTNIISLNNSIYNHNSKFNVNGAVSLTQTASSSSNRQPLHTVHFE